MFGLSGHARGDSMLRKSITRNIGLIVLGMCAAGAVVAALEHGVTPPPTSTHVAAFPPLPVYHAPRPIKLAVPPAGSQVVAVGDSWLDGIGADKPAHGFIQLTAAHFGWNLTLLPGNGGTGYVKSGPLNHKPYAQRIAAQPRNPAVRLIIMEGGINDHAESTYDIAIGQAQAIQAAELVYPNAHILVIGVVSPNAAPGPFLPGIDDTLAAGATRDHIAYINPIDEKWLNGRTASLVHHAGAAENHPTTKGHAILSRLLIKDINRLRK